MSPRENTEAPSADEQDEFWQWAMSFVGGEPDTQLITPEGESIE